MKEELNKSGRKLRLYDGQRRRLAQKGKALGREGLQRYASLFTPETILRRHRRLVARKFTAKQKIDTVRTERRIVITELYGILPTGRCPPLVGSYSPIKSGYLDSLFSLTGKVAVVIGGTGELCGTMALGLAQAGAEVVLVGRNEGETTARLAQIEAAGGKAWFHVADATSKAELAALRDAVVSRSGRVDILVNGAGVNSPTPLLEIPEDEFDRIINANLKGVLFACQIFGTTLLESDDGGSIINIGSSSSRIPLYKVFTYSASKAAMHNLSKNIAREWAENGVRVNLLVPGFSPPNKTARF